MAAKECPGTEQLKSYVDGTLVDGECENLFGHIENCSTCLLELQHLDAFSGNEDPLIEILKTGAENQFDLERQCQSAVNKAKEVFHVESTASEPLDRFEATMIGDYEVVRLLGHGGMGSVYLANHQKLGRQVALKVIARHRLFDPRFQQRFSLEMRAIGALSHPNIVTAFDAREIDGTTVLVTEFIDGLNLGKVISRLGKLSIADACQIASIVAQALTYTDERGFVHRDIKPANIMLSSTGMVKLLDLGLARIGFAGSDHSELTVTGQAMGSPDYVAPEQIQDGRAVDGRTDIYSLGCTLFKMLSGRNVFDDSLYPTSFAKMSAHVNVAPPSLRSVLPDAPSRMVQLVDSMLEKDPNKRPQSAVQVAAALQQFTTGSDLSSLIERALKAPDLSLSKPDADAQPSSMLQPQTLPAKRRFVPVDIAIAGGVLASVIGLFLGVIITITHRDGSQTKLTVPEGTQIELESGDKISIASNISPKPTAEPQKPASSGFLSVENKKSLPTLQNVALFSSNRPQRLSISKVDLPKVGTGEAYVSNVDSSARISPLLMLDGKSQTVAISTSPPTFNQQSTKRSQIYVGKLPAGPFKELFSTELPFSLLDHDPKTGQSLGVLGELGGEGDRELVLFEGLLEGDLRELYRQSLPFQRNQRMVVSEAKLVARNRAIVVMNGVVYCWDLSDCTQVYQTDPNRPLQSKLTFSLDRSLMTFTDHSGVHFADPKTGADLGFVRFEFAIPHIAPFDNNANRIALCTDDSWSTYDLETMTLAKSQTATWSLGSRLLGWIGPDLLLAENGVVIHTQRQIPIWKFESQSIAVSSRQTECVFWADSISIVDKQNGLRIRTMSMPSEELKSALKTMPSVEDMMLTGPGTRVRFELKIPDPAPKGVDFALLKTKMTEIIQRSEWSIDDDSKLKLVAQIAPGKAFTSQYVTLDKAGANSPNAPFSPTGRQVHTPVEITPMISSIHLYSDDELAWFFQSNQAHAYNQAIGNIYAKPRTKEEFIEEMQRARPEWFYGVILPTRIARHPYTHGLGASREIDFSWVPSPLPKY